MAAFAYSPNSTDVNRADCGRDGDPLRVEALQRAQTLVRKIEEVGHNRQYLRPRPHSAIRGGGLQSGRCRRIGGQRLAENPRMTPVQG